MATPEDYPDDKNFSVYWKIKNFSYCIEDINSPEFDINGWNYHLELRHKCADVECTCVNRSDNTEYASTKVQIAFQTADSSDEESISGNKLLVSKDVLFGSRRGSFLPGDALTIRFRTADSTEKGIIFICSQIAVKHYYFLLNTCDKSGYELEKKIIDDRLYGKIQLHLKFMGGVDSTDQFYIEISRSGSYGKCLCDLKVSVLDVVGKALNEVSDFFVIKDNQTRVFPSITKTLNWLELKSLLLSKTLSLKCHLALSRGTIFNDTPIITYFESARSLIKEYEYFSTTFKRKVEPVSATKLQADLKSILDTGTLFDVSLQIDTELIQAHKIILSARSPVFKAMFMKDMRENTNNIVVIEDLNMDTVRQLLLYMYTDTIYNDHWENIKKLYFAADKYEIPSLKNKCVSIMKTNLSVTNVCEAVCLAELHQDDDLKKATLDFISEHDFAVFASEAWKEFENDNSSLAFRIVHEIHRNIRMRLA